MKTPSVKSVIVSDELALHEALQERQYFQVAIFWGEQRRNLPNYLNRFKLHFFKLRLYPDAIALIGAGQYYDPFLHNGIECRCTDVCADVLGNYRPFQSICDLSPLIEFLRYGGHEHGRSVGES